MTAHTLVIRDADDGDGLWEIEHPAGCYSEVWSSKSSEGPGITYWDTDCAISRIVENDPEAVTPFEALDPGRYPLGWLCDGAEAGDRYDEWLVIGSDGRDDR